MSEPDISQFGRAIKALLGIVDTYGNLPASALEFDSITCVYCSVMPDRGAVLFEANKKKGLQGVSELPVHYFGFISMPRHTGLIFNTRLLF